MYDSNPGEIDLGFQVSARFDLARVRVIGSRLYFQVATCGAQQLNNSYYVSYSSVLTHSTSSNSILNGISKNR